MTHEIILIELERYIHAWVVFVLFAIYPIMLISGDWFWDNGWDESPSANQKLGWVFTDQSETRITPVSVTMCYNVQTMAHQLERPEPGPEPISRTGDTRTTGQQDTETRHTRPPRHRQHTCPLTRHRQNILHNTCPLTRYRQHTCPLSNFRQTHVLPLYTDKTCHACPLTRHRQHTFPLSNYRKHTPHMSSY